VIGTPSYMSPEQAAGHPLDARADIYSLGCVLFQCLAGELPFRGQTASDVLLKQVIEIPTPIRERRRGGDTPPRLEALVMHCLEKDPDKRPQAITEVAQTLRDPATFVFG
jgi:serine/threonine protein kinase